MIRLLTAITLAVSATASAEDPQMKGPGLDFSLISATKNVIPGQTLKLGFHIHHHEGFHTYWKNPGVVGVPTDFTWKLPEGFSASEIRWPYPENSFMADYPCHGYERDVTLLIDITTPDVIKGDSITLVADANWMCCAKGCFPGFETISITLPVSTKPIVDPKSSALIKKAEQELPTKSSKLNVSVSGNERIELKINYPAISKAQKIYFFSTDGQISFD